MTCNICGTNLPDGAKFCGTCGTTLAAPAPAPAEPAAPAYEAPVQPVYEAPPVQPVYQQPAYQAPVYQAPPAPVYQQPVYQAPPPAAEPAPPPGSRYAPISSLGFFGYYILFGIPILGLILSIVWSKDSVGSINRQNLAKLMLVLRIIGIVLLVITAIFTAIFWKQIFDLVQEATNGGYYGFNPSDFPWG